MGAHLRPLAIHCEEPGCSSLAKEEVFNRYNASCGKFCSRHAKRRLEELQAGELNTLRKFS